MVCLQVSGVDKISKGFLSLTHLMPTFVISLLLTFFQKNFVIQESHHER